VAAGSVHVVDITPRPLAQADARICFTGVFLAPLKCMLRVQGDATILYQVLFRIDPQKPCSAKADRALDTELKGLNEEDLQIWLGGRDLCRGRRARASRTKPKAGSSSQRANVSERSWLGAGS
jgi:hypothetical protein